MRGDRQGSNSITRVGYKYTSNDIENTSEVTREPLVGALAN